MKIDVGMYVVAKIEKKAILLRVDQITYKDIVCSMESTRHKEPESVTIKSKEVIAVLGRSPSFGKVHGVTVETWKRCEEHEHFGTIDIFHELDKAHEGKLLRAFDKVSSVLKKHGLQRCLPVCTEIRHPSGKMAGKYKFTGKDAEEFPDTLTLYPKEEHEFSHIVFHEIGHAVWFRLFKSAKGRAAWVKAYHSYIKITELSDTDIADITDKYGKSDRPSDAKGQMSEEEAGVFEAMLEYVKRVHSLTIRDLDTLYDSENDLSKYWPQSAETTKKVIEAFGEYSMKSVEEFWAEAFSFYMTGKSMPKNLSTLMEKSLRVAANTR